MTEPEHSELERLRTENAVLRAQLEATEAECRVLRARSSRSGSRSGMVARC